MNSRLLLATLCSLPLYGSTSIFIIDQNAFTFSQISIEEGLYLDLFANIASQDELDFHTQGLSMGIAECCGDWTLGLAAFYSRDHFHHRGRGRIVSIALTPYARVDACPFFAEGELLYAYTRVRSDETTFHTDLLMPHLKFGMEFAHFEPFATFDWAINWAPSHHTSSMLRNELALRAFQCWEICSGTLKLSGVGGYINKAPFHLDSFHNQNLGTWGISLRFENPCGSFAMLSYDGEAGSGYFSNLIQLKLGIGF